MRFIIIMSVILLSGCSLFKEQPIEIVTTCVEKTPLELNNPIKLNLLPVKWYVITENNYVEIFEELKETNTDIVLFGLTDTGYQNMSLNFADIFKYISTQKKITESYKEYYE